MYTYLSIPPGPLINPLTLQTGPKAPLTGPMAPLAGSKAPLTGSQTPLPGPQTSHTGPQTLLAGPQTLLMDGRWVGECAEFLPILQDRVPCWSRCPATL